MQEKKDLRLQMLSQRNGIEQKVKEELDGIICKKVASFISQTTNSIKVVHTFIPMEKEINLFPLLTDLLDRGIKVVCPKALPKRKMENLVLTSLCELETGMYGTQYPASNEVYTGKMDLIIVPGLAFDTNYYRLGYGAGYYDSFLSTQVDAFKLGICYPFQIIDKVPTEQHDMQLNGLFY